MAVRQLTNENTEETKHTMKIKFKKLSETAITPIREHDNDAGWDLFADEDITIKYGETQIVPTNIALEIPDGYFADIRPRSGLTLKTPIRVHLGTIDAGYRSGLGIITENANHKTAHRYLKQFKHTDFDTALDIHIKKGDKIAQLVFHKLPEIELTETTGDLSESKRGLKGFGSSGTTISDKKE